MNVNNPLPTPKIKDTDDVVVNSAPGPLAYTDLDLSAVCGPYKNTVMLRVKNETGGTTTARFRQNGDTDAVLQAGSLINNNIQYSIVPTDGAGIIEWLVGVANNWHVTVLAYWREP